LNSGRQGRDRGQGSIVVLLLGIVVDGINEGVDLLDVLDRALVVGTSRGSVHTIGKHHNCLSAHLLYDVKVSDRRYRIVDAGSAAELRAIDRRINLLSIARRLGQYMNSLIKGDNHYFISGPKLVDKCQSGVMDIVHRIFGGGTNIDHQHDRKRLFFGLEIRDRLRNIVLKDLEVFFLQPGNKAAVAVEHRYRRRNQIGIDTDNVILGRRT